MSGGAAGYGSYSPSSAVNAKAYACTRSFSYSMTSCAVFEVGNKEAARVLPPLAAPSPRFSAREAVTAALLLRAAHGQHARGHDLNAGHQASHPIRFHRRGIHVHLLRHHAAVDCQCDVADAELGAARQQLLDARTWERQRHLFREDVTRRRCVAVLDTERFAKLVLH